jgi:ubiquinone/menaquinone biosynthesis C-methylase UbiE
MTVSSGAYQDEHANWFAENATTSPYNAFCDRPAVLRLIGDSRGQHVLDVGCGAGHYAEALLEHGATVVGLEGSHRLVKHARARVGSGAEIRHHDLEEQLTSLPDSTFDGAVMALVLHHVDARAQLLAELARVLRPGAWLVISTMHPTSDWARFGGSYYEVEKIERTVAGGLWTMRYWRMPLDAFLAEILAAGFMLEQLVEPRPVPELAEVDPEAYEKLQTTPCFLAVKVRLPSA